MAKAKSTAVAVNEERIGTVATVPDFAKGKTARTGNLDTSDLIVPRVKIMQKISPEIDAFDAAVAGEFWHSIAETSMGAELRAIPIYVRKSMVLWAPRGDERRILARSNDCIHWDVGAGQTFDVKPKNAGGKTVTYELADTVAESAATLGNDTARGLGTFGSGIPGDPNSPPAASITYSWLWHFLDFPELSPGIIINTRSSVQPSKSLWAKIGMRDGEMFSQVFKIEPFLDGTAAEPFYNYKYTSDGYIEDEDLYNRLMAQNKSFGDSNWRANDEDDDTSSGDGKAKGDSSGRGGKF